jgi:hypothetical protein
VESQWVTMRWIKYFVPKRKLEGSTRGKKIKIRERELVKGQNKQKSDFEFELETVNYLSQIIKNP